MTHHGSAGPEPGRIEPNNIIDLVVSPHPVSQMSAVQCSRLVLGEGIDQHALQKIPG